MGQLLGHTFGANASNLTNGFLVIYQFTATATGNMDQIRIQMTAADNVLVGLYADSSGSPGSLLVSVGSTAVSIGTNTISCAKTAIVSGTPYWFAVESQNAVSVSDGTGGTLEYKANTYGSGFPNPAGTGFTTQALGILDMQGWETTYYVNVNNISAVTDNVPTPAVSYQINVSDTTAVTDSTKVYEFISFSHYSAITIDHTKVGSSDSTNFPVLISGTYPFLATVGNGGVVQNSSGYDVGFYSDAALTQKLNWETETYTASNGLVNYWVQVPTVSHSSDTVIYLAYGSAGVTTDQSNPTGGVSGWLGDTNFKGVWHLPTVTGGASSVLDSTSKANNATPTGSPTNTTGQIGGAGSFVSASSQYLVDSSATGLAFADNSAHTISAWIKTSTSSAQVIFATFGTSVAAGVAFVLGQTNSGKLETYLLNSAASAGRWETCPSGTTVSDGIWHHVVATYDGSSSSAGLSIYVDASLQAHADSVNSAPSTLANATFNIGRRLDNVQFFNGQIDETRISCGLARSAAWITAEYNNQFKPDKATFGAAGFYSLSPTISVQDSTTVTDSSSVVIVSQITVSDSSTVTDPVHVYETYSYTYIQSVIVDHTRVGSSDSALFPVLISGTYAFLATTGNNGQVQNGSGFDVAFYGDKALTQRLNWETETYTASNGLVNYWVQVPNVSHSSDTVFYVAYGNNAITTDQSNKIGVWDNNFTGVWHLPNGTTLTANDSTTNANNGTLQNTPTAIAGEIDGGGAFASASSQYISLADAATLKPSGAWTISAWFKLASTTAVTTILSSYSQNSNYAGIAVGVNVDSTTPHKMGVLQGNNTGTSSGNFGEFHGTTTVDDNTWRYAVMSSDGSSHSVSIYINNGSNEGSLAFGTALAPAYSTNFPRIGVTETASGTRQGYWPGSLDEIRFSNVARSTDWMAAEYNNETKPDKAVFGATGFYTISNLVTVSDTTAVTDSVQVLISGGVSVSDTSAVTDVVTVVVEGNVIVSDISGLTENVAVTVLAVPDLNVNTSDTSGVTDNVQLNDVEIGIVSDTSGVTEFVQVFISGSIAVSDSSPITDFSVVRVEGNVVISDTSAATDSVIVTITAVPDLNVNVSDSSAVTDNVQLNDTDIEVVSDTTAITDSVAVLISGGVSVSDNSAVTDASVVIVAGNVVVSDTSAATDSVTVVASDSGISVSDLVGSTESMNVVIVSAGQMVITVADSSAATDTVALLLESNLAVSDQSIATDSVVLVIGDDVKVSDSSGVSESSSVQIQTVGDLLVNVADAISFSEASTVTIIAVGDQLVAVNDGSAVTESEQVVIQGVSDLLIDASDTIAITESVLISLNNLVLSIAVSDVIGSSETVAALLVGAVITGFLEFFE